MIVDSGYDNYYINLMEYWFHIIEIHVYYGVEC